MGKLMDAPGGWQLFLVAVELGLAAALVLLGAGPGQLVALAAVAACSSYLGYAILRRANSRCACFGSRLPQIGRGAQIARNLVLFVVTLGWLFDTRRGARAASALRLLGKNAAVIVGMALAHSP